MIGTVVAVSCKLSSFCSETVKGVGFSITVSNGSRISSDSVVGFRVVSPGGFGKTSTTNT